MNCRELVELLTDYLEGALRTDQRAEVQGHLSGCDGCTTYLEQIRITIRLTGMLPEDPVPSDARRASLAIFRDWRASS